MKPRNLRLIFCIFLCLPLFLGSGVSSPLYSDQPERLKLYQTPVNKFLSPGKIKISKAGTVAVWDHDFQNYHFFKMGDTKVRKIREKKSELFTCLYQADILREFGFTKEAVGFWDGSGNFWYYHHDLATKSSTFPVTRIRKKSVKANLQGPIRTIYPLEDHWIVQPGTGPIYSFDPYAPGENRDTSPYNFKGRIFEIIDENRIFTRLGDTIYVYNRGRQLYHRKFNKIVGVSISGNNLYILERRGRILKLSLELKQEYVFDFKQNLQLNDFAVYEHRAFLTGKNGIYILRLGNTERTFFTASRTVQPRKVFSITPQLSQKPKITRIWAAKKQAGRETATIYLKGETKTKRLAWTPAGFSEEGEIPPKKIPSSPSRYFQFEHSFWSPRGRLYYYFPDEHSIEIYNRENKIINKVNLKWSRLNQLEDIQFVGASQQNIIISGQFIFPKQGARRVLAIFDSGGVFKRLLKIKLPPNSNGWLDPRQPVIRYGGGNYFYLLCPDFIRRYDLQGYPRGVIERVQQPVDLFALGDKLFILDQNGWRISRFDRRDPPVIRYGSPPTGINIKNVLAVSEGKAILVVRENKKEPFSLYEYNLSDKSYQQVFTHPEKNLRYPFHSDSGETLFFWAGRKENARHELYFSDFNRYQARSLNIRARPRGEGLYREGLSAFLLPVKETVEDTAPHYRYYYLNGDTQGRILNSGNLLRLAEKPFKGFYGLTKSDSGYSLVTGLINQSSDTGKWRWQKEKTLFTTSKPLIQLKRHGQNIFLTQKISPDASRLLMLNLAKNSETEPVKINTVWRGGGDLKWFTANKNFYRALQKYSGLAGKILEIYPRTRNPSGGIRGRLTVEEPANLKNIDLLVQPGGVLLKTMSGGRFTDGDLPSGYLEISPLSYKYHFVYPFSTVVYQDRYNINNKIPVVSPTDVSMLKKGIQNYHNQDYSVATSRLKVFRTMVDNGPQYRCAGFVLKEIYWKTGAYQQLYNHFLQAPDEFAIAEVLKLYQHTRPLSKKLKLLKFVKKRVSEEFDQFINYHLFFLLFKLGKKQSAPGALPLLQPIGGE